MVLKLFENYKQFLAMTKKIVKRPLTIKRPSQQTQIIKPEQLKVFAVRRVKQLQMSKMKCSKISKVPADETVKPKRSNPIQKEIFQEIIQQSAFQCPVCLELMIEPTLLQCGHAYCSKCIQELMIYKSNCGVCRNLQIEPEFLRSKYLETLIEKVVLRKSEHFLNFYCRLADVQNWKRARNVTVAELTKGSLVDFRDKELKWRKAEITRINYDEAKASYQIEVKYKKGGQNVEESFSYDSSRYAKFSYYTRMKYLEPRDPTLGLLVPVNQGPLLTPIPNSYEDIERELRVFESFELEGNAEQPLIQNMETANFTVYPSLSEDEFLNEIFQSNREEAQEMIELLA